MCEGQRLVDSVGPASVSSKPRPVRQLCAMGNCVSLQLTTQLGTVADNNMSCVQLGSSTSILKQQRIEWQQV